MVASAQSTLAKAQSTLGKVGPGKHRGIEKTGEVAAAMQPAIDASFGNSIPLSFEFWDGSKLSPRESVATLSFNSPDAITRLLWMPNELGLCRAYVAGDIDVDGDLYDVLTTFRDSKPAVMEPARAWRALPAAVMAAKRVGALSKPLPLPPEEARLHGWRHSLRRDASAIGHHYDVGNDFYRLVLGETMTYSCARFALPRRHVGRSADGQARLDLPQARPATAPWRSLARRRLRMGLDGHSRGHALRRACRRHHHQPGASRPRPAASRGCRCDGSRRDPAAGLPRSVGRGVRCDLVVGMAEHVGHAKLSTYLDTLRSVLVPQGRLLNHAISSVGGSTLGPRSFVGRYVFPDGELIDVGKVVLAMEEAGFEVRDVESLREHYARTLRCWVANLESQLGRSGEVGRRAASQDLAVVHGRFRRRFRRRRDRHPSGARCGARRTAVRRACRPRDATGRDRRSEQQLADRVDHQAGQAADDRSVDADELQVATDL